MDYPRRPSPEVYAELVAIGDELLAGDVVNRNAAFLGQRVRRLGIVVTRAVVVRDRIEEIVQAIGESVARADTVLCCGGLGPTTDDRTTEAIAAAAAVAVCRDEDAQSRLRAKFCAWGREMPESNLKQADFPQGAEILPNPIGTAEGFGLQIGTSRVWVTPGVPREMQRMMIEEIEPRLRSLWGIRPFTRRIYRLIGLGESAAAERVESVVARMRATDRTLRGMFVHYRASMPEVSVVLEALPDSDGLAADSEALRRFDEPFAAVLAPALYGCGEQSLPERVVAALRRAQLRMSVAESCTGGRVAGLLTAIPGASQVFEGGIVAYDNRVKQAQLRVDESLLAQYGAVSEPVARAMAQGARVAMKSDLAVAVTGIAGPEGAGREKTVGTVYFAVSDATDTTAVRLQLRGDRVTVQRSAALWALKLVWDRLVQRGYARIDDGPSV